MPEPLLARIAATSRERVRVARAAESEARLLQRALASPRPPALELGPQGFDVIAEFKRRTPSSKASMADPRPEVVAEQARRYAAAGAAAVSVLTEPQEFDGALEDLAPAASAAGVPVLRKDFVVDAYQVLEARAAGASGVLLILRLMDSATLDAALAAARETGLFVLLEAFDRADLDRSAELVAANIEAPSILAGLNCRDLDTLAIDRTRFATLRAHLPRGVPAVAESGILTARDAAAVARLGYRAALVGGALMRAPDPGTLLIRMLEAGRREARSCASV